MATKKYLDTSGLTRLWAKITSRLSTKVDKESGKGLSTNDYTTAEKTKLSGIATGAEVNQNAFSNVVVGSTTIAADGKTDTLTIAAGTNITLTPDATNDKLTITNSYSLPSAGTSLGGVKSGGVATISGGQITAISKVANSLTLKGNGTTAGTFNGSAATSVNVVGSGSTTVTGASGTITITTPTSIKNPNALTVGSKTYDGSAAITIAASDLGLASAMKFLGTSTTAITDGATTSPITVSDSSITPTAGNVVLYGQKEFVWTGSAWEELGNEGSYKVVQAAVSSPATSGTTNAFIDTISQDTNGKITATKKSIALSGGTAATADATVAGGVTVSGSTISVAKKTLTAGSNVTITGASDKITIAAADTHYTTKLITGASSTATANAAATNGNVYLNLLDNSTIRNSHNIKGTGAATVTSDANGVITINATNTTYSVATSSANGLMSAADKAALDALVETGNSYVLPAATSSTLGGVKIGSNITNSSGTISLTKANVTAALGYTPPTTNTTYSVMGAASSSAAGTSGLVPAPAAGKQSSFLRGDGTWVVPTNTTYSAATTSAAGLMSASDKSKLDGITSSADAVSFSQTQTSGTKIGAITINGTATDIYSPTIPTSLKNPNALTIQANGTSLGTYDGSAAKTFNLTYSNVGAAAASHTHSYAGSSSAGGAATSANKLNTNAGSETEPVYFSNGVPVVCTDVELAITESELAAILV